MDLLLTDTEVRVLGCLLEKEMATPDYYPLSLNALTNACNQKTNREPVVSYTEEIATQALSGLKAQQLAWQTDASRVPKFGELFMKRFNLLNREAAVLCVLMLRGPQTVGELRGRTERMHAFANLEAVQETLTRVAEMGLVTMLARQPGAKEPRYAHLLSGPPEEVSAAPFTPGPAQPMEAPGETRLSALEEEVLALRQELEALREAFLEFKGQF